MSRSLTIRYNHSTDSPKDFLDLKRFRKKGVHHGPFLRAGIENAVMQQLQADFFPIAWPGRARYLLQPRPNEYFRSQ